MKQEKLELRIYGFLKALQVVALMMFNKIGFSFLFLKISNPISTKIFNGSNEFILLIC